MSLLLRSARRHRPWKPKARISCWRHVNCASSRMNGSSPLRLPHLWLANLSSTRRLSSQRRHNMCFLCREREAVYGAGSCCVRQLVVEATRTSLEYVNMIASRQDAAVSVDDYVAVGVTCNCPTTTVTGRSSDLFQYPTNQRELKKKQI